MTYLTTDYNYSCFVYQTIFYTGWLADTTGNYDGSFYFCAAFYLAGGLVASLIPVKWHCGPSGNVSIRGNVVKKPQIEVYRIEEESSECKIRSWHQDLQL